ncbi:hypothetical protein KY333_05835 [Candidatus Woesearchaeota archaeon]|nr:hypothetical protein [Candidatus Woesearchaeota archaeon]
MNDEERKMWVMNDEGLYNWWKESHIGLNEFVKRNRETLTGIINKKLGNVV